MDHGSIEKHHSNIFYTYPGKIPATHRPHPDDQELKHVFSPATLADVRELVQLENILFHTDQCSCHSFRYLIRNATVILARTVADCSLVGYAILLSRKNSKKMRIYSLGIAPSFQNSGLGTRFISLIEGTAQRAGLSMLTLEVCDTNLGAIALYDKCGFQQYGFRFSYYEDGSHALLMRKPLAEIPSHLPQ